MSLTNSFSRYGSVAKSFHWATVLLIFTAFPVGYFANELAHQINAADFDGDAGIISRATLLFSLHKTLGVTAFFTALLRIPWAITQEKPGLLHPDNRGEALVAEAVHWLLYALMLLVPLSGWIMHASEVGYAPIWWPFGQGLPFVPQSHTLAEIAAGVHWLFVWTLFGVVGLHVAGALKHHIIDKDSTLVRMLPRSGALPTPPEQTHDLKPLALAVVALLAVLGTGRAIGAFAGHDHDHGPVVVEQQATHEDHHDHGEHSHDTGHSHGDHAHDNHDQAAAPTPETAPDLTTDHPGVWTVETGALGITVIQSGSAVEGGFANWSADITFDEPAARGPAGTVKVTIDIASLDLGSVTTQALGSDYFNALSFPTAIFEAEIEKLESGYQALGTLTIRDQTQPFSLPFELEIDGDTATMSGTSNLKRLDFDVGLAQQDESTVGFIVDINVALTAKRGSGS
ncbi:cytochrome b/b6 domain-containing protein [Sulfitobacter pontiacus]|uniref:cytochrome b/b6 domain-containing protein n=1 Tax=Sulfitobacter pontiacus TaxID=60137 RepID=UPI003299BF19